MTFSSSVKNELCKLENKNQCCEKAECYAVLLFHRFFSKHPKVHSEHAKTIQNLCEKITQLTGCVSEIQLHYMKKNYIFSVPNQNDLQSIKDYFNSDDENINYNNFECPLCKNAFVKGAFLACGTISNPKKQYKIEFVVYNKELAKVLFDLINSLNFFSFKLIKRKEKYVIYSSDSSVIEDFLTLIGAKNSSMTLMQEKMYKEELNKINRQTNFETANIDKTISASAKHIAAITLIYEKLGENFLVNELAEIAKFRLENPEMSLKDIALKLNISRSAVNHRLLKIQEIAKNIDKE